MPHRGRTGSACAVFAGLVVAALSLTACATPGAAVDEGPVPSSVPDQATGSPPPPTTSPTSTIDPSDMTTWTLSGEGVGPIDLGAAYPEVLGAVPDFEKAEWCEGVVRLHREGTATAVLFLSADGASVETITVSGMDVAAPATAEGISLGSSMDDLFAAHPDLSLTNQPAADAWTYATPTDAGGSMSFLTYDDEVQMMGVGAGIPTEPCA